MPATLHNVMSDAIEEYYVPVGAQAITIWHNPSMSNEDKNGGPNHLPAWREYSKMSQDELAAKVVPPTTQGQIAHLESGRSGLSAKWLRRLADAMGITPGMLLDHDPRDLDAEMIEIWVKADKRQRRQISEISKAILKTGTDDI